MLFPLLAASLSLAPIQEREPQVFRSGIRVIRLDVSVVGKKGRPISGLSMSDFVVKENGKRVELNCFEAFSEPMPGEMAEGDGIYIGQALEDPSRRRVILLVDAAPMTMAQMHRARTAAANYVRDHTSMGDWVRLVNLSTGEAWDGEIPEDRYAVVAAAHRLARIPSPGMTTGRSNDPIIQRVDRVAADTGGFSQTDTTGAFLSVFNQTRDLLGMLETTLVSLGGVEGRKALILISPGFPQLRNFDEQLEHLSSLAREVATSIYFVDTTGLDGLLPTGPRQQMASAFGLAWARSGGAMDLAEATGGFTTRFSNDLTPALRRVAAEMRTYYILGYTPPRAEPGKFRRVKVKVNVAGAKARTKKGYIFDPRRSF